VTDVVRALVLPDLNDPGWPELRNLALFWDQVTCPCYDEDSFLPEDDLLVREGVFQELPREMPINELFPVGVSETQADGEWGFRVGKDEEGLPQIDLVRMDVEESERQRQMDLMDWSDKEIEDLAAIAYGKHLRFIDDALSIAAMNNLAPVSHSLGGHLAAVVGSSEAGDNNEAPAKEAALISVVVEGFSIGEDVSSEELLQFREKSGQSQARLRASLVDLAAQLRQSGPPEALLAEARDVYRNRVEPALGDLEEVLKENGIRFFLKSLLGATAIAVAPIEPVSTSVGAAKVMGQTIDYSYSKSRLVREHPYGYLHEVRQKFPRVNSEPLKVETAIKTPRETLWRLWRDWWFEGRDFLKSSTE
jgi:hypothetical protein